MAKGLNKEAGPGQWDEAGEPRQNGEPQSRHGWMAAKLCVIQPLLPLGLVSVALPHIRHTSDLLNFMHLKAFFTLPGHVAKIMMSSRDG